MFLTSFMNGMSRAFETKPGTSLDVVTSTVSKGSVEDERMTVRTMQPYPFHRRWQTDELSLVSQRMFGERK